MESKTETTKIAIFRKKEIRKTVYNKEWWFVIEDVVQALTDSVQPSGYIKDMRRRDPELSKGWGQIATPLLMETTGGLQKINCANTEGIFRIIQSIPSPKAEPFKRWLARVGYERIQEIEDPELAMKRIRAIYKAKGYSDDWIEKRVRGIAVREELTDEWNKRGIKNQNEYAILTAEISKAAFGMTPSEYRKHKGLEGGNLRDHMNDLEVIFSMLGEASTTKIARARDAQGFEPNKRSAIDGGSVAGNARKELEHKSGEKVISRENYLQSSQNKKLVKK